MRVPLLDLSGQYRTLAEPLRAEVEAVLAAQQFILGPKVAAFEAAMAHYCRVKHALGVSSGTDALLAILMTLGISAGDAVITTGYSFFATGGCIARVGATPIFVDIEPTTYNISPQALERYLTSCQRRADGGVLDGHGRAIRAIVPVHLFGLCCDMAAITRLAEQFNLLVLEDAAQAIGADYPLESGPAKAGTMGRAGSYSFYPSKNLGAAGDAGLIVSHDDSFADRLRVCRQHGMERRYYHNFVGGNFRLDEVQAAILQVKLPYLDQWSALRRDKADFYRTEFDRLDLTGKIILPEEPYRSSGVANHHIYHQYVIRSDQRDSLQRYLTEEGVGTAVYYPLGLHQQQCFRDVELQAGKLPETERAAREALALPIFPELTREQQQHVVGSIAKFFGRN